MSNKNILITGGAGFIGSHLAEALLNRGDKVTIIDNLSTGSLENITDFKDHPRFSYVIDDVMNRPVMEELINQVDIIFHLAAAVGVKLIVENPVRTIETNVRATELVLELAASLQKKVIIASSSEVYGKLDKEFFSEDDDLLLGPTSKLRWSYAASKIIDEFLAKAYYKQLGLPVVIVRFFNIIGPRQTGQYGMVVPTFIKQALSGQPITVYGDGSQRRSFTWVKDAVNALIALSEHPEAEGKVFNIGHKNDISIYELAQMVKKITGSSSEIVFVDYDKAYEQSFEDIRRRRPDISKIQNLIGYQPTLELPEILKRIIDYYKEKL